jgi:anti-anti-sigma factor
MEIKTSNGVRPGERILRLNGFLDLMTVPGFLGALRAENAPAVIIDFSGVRMLDSAGVGALIQAYVSFRNAKQKLALVGFSRRLMEVLEITRVRNLLPIFPTEAEAESSLK